MTTRSIMHFFALGALMFAIERFAFGPEQQTQSITLTFSHATQGLLLKEERERLGRNLSAQEKEDTLRRWEDETLLVADARRLGLHVEDPIILRRLEEKMRYLLEDAAESREASDEELEAYLAKHRGRFMLPPTLSLEQHFFSRVERGAHLDRDAQNALKALRSGEAVVSDKHPSGRWVKDRSAAQLRREFGRLLTDKVRTTHTKGWAGPIASAKGLHLVRIIERREAQPAKLNAVRPYVEAAYRDMQRESRLRAEIDALRARRGLPARQQP